MPESQRDAPRGFSLLLTITAALIGLIGLALFAGGAWLLAVGGSFYYALAGIGLIATAFLLVRRSPLALLVYAAVVTLTLVWAVAEIGFDWWQLVPRGDVIFLIGLVLLTPWIRRRLRPGGTDSRVSGRRGFGLALTASLAAAAIVGLVSMLTDTHDWNGSLPGRARLSNCATSGA